MQTIIDGRSAGYAEAGQGRPLVLIHGYPFDRKMWEPQLTGLADAAHLIAPDLWGFGESAPVPQASLGAYADLVRGLMDYLGVTQPAVICGLSMGGYIAFEFYRRYRERVAGLILADTRAAADSEEQKVGRERSAALAREKGVSAIAAQMLPRMLAPATYHSNARLVEQVAQLMMAGTVEGIVAALGAMRDRPDSTGLLTQIRLPALVIGGEEDQISPRQELEGMARALPQGRLKLIPGAGHLSNLEQPDAFNAGVREFLQQQK